MNKIEKLERERTDLKNKYYEETKAITEKIRQAQWVKRKATFDAREKKKLLVAKRDEQIKEEGEENDDEFEDEMDDNEADEQEPEQS